MSISNLFETNKYKIYADELHANTQFVNSLVSQSLQATNGTNQITLGTGGGLHETVIDCPGVVGANQLLHVPDSGLLSSSFILADDITGQQNINTVLNLTQTSNQLNLGAPAHLTTINSSAIAGASTIINLNDPGVGSTSFILGDKAGGLPQQINSPLDLTPATNQITFGQGGHVSVLDSVAPAAASQTLTLYDSGVASTNVQLGVDPAYVTLLGDGTVQNLTASQSGLSFLLPSATANTQVNLPAAKMGLKYKFILSSLGDGVHFYTISSTGANIFGFRISANHVYTGITNIAVDPLATIVGDTLNLWSDGTNYYVQALAASWGDGT